MIQYVGDSSRMVIHRVKDLQDACLENSLDIARVTEFNSSEFLEYLTRSEHWHECPHCFHAHPLGAHTNPVVGALDATALPSGLPDVRDFGPDDA